MLYRRQPGALLKADSTVQDLKGASRGNGSRSCFKGQAVGKKMSEDQLCVLDESNFRFHF